MTATTNELIAPNRGVVATLRRSMTRDELFSGLCDLGCATGLLGRTLSYLNLAGRLGGIMALESNVIVWAAAFAGLYLRWTSDSRGQIRTSYRVVAAVFLPFVIVPSCPLS